MTGRRRVHPKCERGMNEPTGRRVHNLFTIYHHIYSQLLWYNISVKGRDKQSLLLVIDKNGLR